jgi:hypothetical protein
MVPDPQRVEAVFYAALEKPSAEERLALLDEAGAGAPALRQRVEALLQAHAVVLLRRALLLVPAGQRGAYWRENMKDDKALTPLHRFPPFVRLSARIEEPDG